MKKALLVLLLVCTLMCISCAPSSAAAAAKKLEANGYYVMIADENNGEVEEAMSMFEMDDDGVYAVVCGSEDEGGPDDTFAFVYVIFCDNASSADRVTKDCNEFLDDYMEELLEDLGEGEYDLDDFCAVKKGKVVLFGLKEIVDIVS